jgi:hypothetical protein
MQIKLLQSDTYKHPVTVALPGGGETSFQAEYKLLPKSEQEKLLAESDTPDDDLIKKVLVGWTGFKDLDNTDVPYTPEALAQVLDCIPYTRAIVAAYFESVSGAAAKNSNKRRGR